MTCYHPLHAFDTGCLTASGKREIIVTSNYKESLPVKKAVEKFGHDYKYDPKHMAVVDNVMCFVNPDEVPCGKCIGCKLDKSADWATRCMVEASLHAENWFITLTYDDESLPEDGKVSKRDIQLFNKRLRAAYGDGIRFFLCGEYGDLFLRPHYHGIYFNLHLDDLKPISRGYDGNIYYSSKKLERIWNNGFVLIGAVSFRSAGYVARYSMKGFKDELKDFKPFLLMSRNPGIGHDWIESNLVKVYNTDTVYVDLGDRKMTKSNRYFDSQLEKIYPDLLADWKDTRKVRSEISTTGEMVAHDYSDCDEMRDVLEKRKRRSIERLKRNKL